MATTSIMGLCAVRVCRLLSDGSISYNNPKGNFTLLGGMSKLSYSFEIEKGADIFEFDACGLPVVIRKRPDIVKRVTGSLTLANQDYRFDEITELSVNLLTVATVTGRAIQAGQGCTGTQTKNGVSLEMWSEQWQCAAAATAPYMRSISPRAYFAPNGHDRQNGVALPVYDFFGVVNNKYHAGPLDDVTSLVGVTNWPWADLDDTALPNIPMPNDYQRVNADIS